MSTIYPINAMKQTIIPFPFPFKYTITVKNNHQTRLMNEYPSDDCMNHCTSYRRSAQFLLAYHRTALSGIGAVFLWHAVHHEEVNTLARVKLTDLDPNYDVNFDEIEIPDEVVAVYQQHRRAERNLERKRQRHHAVLTISSKTLLNSLACSISDDLEESLMDEALRKQILLAVKSLPSVQQRRLKAVFFDGLSCAEVARREKVSRAAVTKTIKKALKNIFLSFFPKRG